MTEIGRIALGISLILAVYSTLAAIVAARKHMPSLLVSARRAGFVVCGLVSLASIALIYAILTHDFGVAYVYQYSSRDMSLFYLLSSFWAGNEGSLLLWAWVLAIFAL